MTTTTGDGIGAIITEIIVSGNTITSCTFLGDSDGYGIGQGYKSGDTIRFDATAMTGGSGTAILVLTAGSLVSSTGRISTLGFVGVEGGAFSNTLYKGQIDPAVSYQNFSRIFECDINNAATQDLVLTTSSTGSTQDVGGCVTAMLTCDTDSLTTWTFTGGHNIPNGTIFQILTSTLTSISTGWGASPTTTGTTIFQIINGTVVQIPESNNFTIGVDVGVTSESGSVTGFNNYEKGDVGFIAPTFIRVTPDPTTTLVGLPGGEVTLMH